MMLHERAWIEIEWGEQELPGLTIPIKTMLLAILCGGIIDLLFIACLIYAVRKVLTP